MARRKCEVCKKNEAIYAAQKIGEEAFSFSTLGFHYRSFKMVKVCGDCMEINREGIEKKYNEKVAA